MKEKVFRPIVKQILRAFDMEVFDVHPDQNERRPDFKVVGEKDTYIIELKIKGDDPEEIEQENAALLRGEIVTTSTPTGPRNRLSGIIKDGVKQMVEFDPTGKSFRIVWLHSVGKDSSFHNERFHSTLFGTTYLFSLDLPRVVHCFYFYDSAFFSCRHVLDAAILSDERGVQLCVNSLSYRVECFRKSELAIKMSAGLCDPDILEKSKDDVMLADCDIDRKMSEEVILYLQKKYGLKHLQILSPHRHTASLALTNKK